MKKLKMALIGMGGRGASVYREILKFREDVEWVAFCDADEDRCTIIASETKSKISPNIYRDYKECIDNEKLDAIIIFTSWVSHLEICRYAMEKGIAVGCEVGGGYSIEQLWDLVKCYERTKTPVMFLENCCYGRMELLTLKLKRLGLLGEIVHCQGGYRHDLRKEILSGAKGGHYRFQEYLHRNCENYPTHEIGPIAEILDINKGNRFVSLYSVASKSIGLETYIKNIGNEELKNAKFTQGDIITTTIKCQNGETVMITLDTTLPRFYSRAFLVQGTNGLVSEESDCVYIDSEDSTHLLKDYMGNVSSYYEKYDHELWKKDYGVVNVHGGIDERCLDEFFRCLKAGEEMPIDVYDMATWMCITTLSEQSITMGQSVIFPDFTSGAWIRRKNTFAQENGTDK